MRDSVLRLAEEIENMIEAELPIKEDAYVVYNLDRNDFFVSTTDDERYNGRIRFDDVIQEFIDSHVRGFDGTIENSIGETFARRLEDAAKRIRAETEDDKSQDGV